MLQRFLHNKTAMITVAIVCLTALVGIFAPWIVPNDPYETDILNKFAGFSAKYPLGTDNLGRCILSRMIYGIRPTLGLAVLTMIGTIGLGALMGLLAGYFRGIPEEIIMRTVDIMLSFPSPAALWQRGLQFIRSVSGNVGFARTGRVGFGS